MNTFQLISLPLGAFWLTFKSLLDAADFVNKMRDKVISGMDGNNRLGHAHRRALRFDWCLSMLFTVFASTMFSGIIFWIAWYLRTHATDVEPSASRVVCVVAFFPLLAGVFFVVCGISDLRVMNRTLAQQAASDATDGSNAAAKSVG